MGWQIELAKHLKNVPKVSKVPKVRFERIGSLGARFSKWIQGTKISSWFKAGVAGGIGYTIYHAWSSGVSTTAKATGLPDDTVEAVLFAGLGIMVAYVAARLLFPNNSGTTVVIDSGGCSGRQSGSRSNRGRSRRRR